MRKHFFITFVVWLLVGAMGCGASRPTARTTTLETLREQFASIETTPIPPLEEVQLAPREEPDISRASTYRISLGETAPFTGLLLNDPAAAYIVTEYQAIGERYGASLLQQRDRDYARLTRDLESVRLERNGDRERFLIVLETQERYIEDLEGLAFQDNTITDVLTIGGAAALGILLGIVIGFLAN